MPAVIVFSSTEANRSLFKKALIQYFSGTVMSNTEKTAFDIEKTKLALQAACTDGFVKISAKAFAQKIFLSEDPRKERLDSEIITILELLCLPTDIKTYTDQGITTLHDLLSKDDLLRKKNIDLDYLWEIIDSSHPPVQWTQYLYKPMAAIIVVLGFCYTQPQYFWTAIDWISDMIPIVYQWLYHYLVQLHNLPVIGMSLQIALLAYYLRYTFQHGFYPSDEKIRTLLFRALAITLNFLAHLISYWAAGTLPFLPAALFIISSLIDVVVSITAYCFPKSNQLDRVTPSVHTKAWSVRHQCKVERNKYIFLIQSIYAISISTMVIGCALLPPSVILAMAYTLSMALAFLIKDFCISYIRHDKANKEQTAVFDIYTSPEYNPEKVIEEHKADFNKYTKQKMSQYGLDDDPLKKEGLEIEIFKILQTKPFVLTEAKTRFEQAISMAHHWSPSPQNQSNKTNSAHLALSAFAHNTPSRLVGGRRLDLAAEGYNPGSNSKSYN